jgi:CRP-like cAMP-binding protein
MPLDLPATSDELRRVTALSTLTDAHLSALLEHGTTLAYADGATLFQEGDDADVLYFIVEGSVRVHGPRTGGGRIEFALLGPGSILGEMGMLIRRKRGSAASALGRVRVLRIGHEVLMGDYESGARYALSLLHGMAVTLAQRLDASNRRVSLREDASRPAGTDLDAFRRTILEEWAL